MSSRRLSRWNCRAPVDWRCVASARQQHTSARPQRSGDRGHDRSHSRRSVASAFDASGALSAAGRPSVSVAQVQRRAFSSRTGGSAWDRFDLHPRGHLAAIDEWGDKCAVRSRSAQPKSPARSRRTWRRVSPLRGQLARTEKALTKAKNRADRWRKEAKAQKGEASRARARVEKRNRSPRPGDRCTRNGAGGCVDGRDGVGSAGGRADERRWGHGAGRNVERRPAARGGTRPRD